MSDRSSRQLMWMLVVSCLAGVSAFLFPLVIESAANAETPIVVWSPPLNLFETTGRASEVEVVADLSGAVHVFWAYGAPGTNDAGSGQSIYYARLEGGAWSEPVDVLTTPGDRVARTHSVAADDRGYLHIAWSGGDSIWYSRAYAAEAGSARGWSEPVSFVLGVTALEPCIAGGAGGEVYVVWTQARAGLMLARSADGGATWDSPRAIYARGSDTELVRWGRIAVDGRGRLHVALTHTLRTEQPSGGRTDPNYLYYLRSEDGGETWTDPWRVVEEPDFGEMNVATWGEDVVHLAWNGRAGRHGRYHRWSEDGGRNWSEVAELLSPRDPIGDGGLTGFPALAVDSAGVLHLVSATGPGDYHFAWSDGQWSQPTLISPGLDGKGVTFDSSSLEQPSLAISEGNRLHAVFHDGFQRIWYTGATVDAPRAPSRPLPTPIRRLAAPTLAPTVRPPTPTPEARREAYIAETEAAVWPVFWAIAPTLVLLAAVIAIARVRRRP